MVVCIKIKSVLYVAITSIHVCSHNYSDFLSRVTTVQIDSPAQLANVLVNVTNNTDEIESEDVSLTVGLLSMVTNSPEDLQQQDVSRHSYL